MGPSISSQSSLQAGAGVFREGPLEVANVPVREQVDDERLPAAEVDLQLDDLRLAVRDVAAIEEHGIVAAGAFENEEADGERLLLFADGRHRHPHAVGSRSGNVARRAQSVTRQLAVDDEAVAFQLATAVEGLLEIRSALDEHSVPCGVRWNGIGGCSGTAERMAFSAAS